MEITINVTSEQIRQLDNALRRYDANAGDVYCPLCGVSQQGKPTHGDGCIMQRLWAATLAEGLVQEIARQGRRAERKGDLGTVPSRIA